MDLVNSKQKIDAVQTKLRALGYTINVVPDMRGLVPHLPQTIAAIHPPSKRVWISGSIPPPDFAEAIAHEAGHALQWESGAWVSGDCGDYVELFKCEMDAIDRAEREFGIDMRRNREGNYYGYCEHWGLEHLGRS